MKIIEFCGLPGTGKSTLCRKYEKNLKAQGYSVKNVQILPLLYRGLKRRIFLLKVSIDPGCIKLRRVAKRTIKGITHDNRKIWLQRILEMIYLINRGEKIGDDYAIMDEGFLQFVTSICHGEEINEGVLEFTKAIIENVYKGRDYKILYLDVDKEEIIRRIAERNREGDRFLSDSKEEMERRLIIKEKNLLKCLDMVDGEHIKRIHLSGNESESELMEKFR